MSKGKALAGSLIPILMVGLLVFYGCSKDNGIVGPAETGPDNPGGEINILQVADDGYTTCGGSFSSEEYIIAAEGGTVELQFSFYDIMTADHTIDIPAGALPADTTMSISAPIPWMAVVELGTDGIDFLHSVNVELNWSGRYLGSLSPKSDLGVFRWDPDMYTWEEVPAKVSFGAGWITAVFQRDHFSRYAVAER
jgi:hypothetical protein